MSKVVFVGNVPYNMSEEDLIKVFRPVGQVVGFRLVYDRDTGKPKGYGFCEFADAETAASAVRNLNNVDVNGRQLRIDLADSDPFLEGKTTVRGELIDAGGARESRKDAFLAQIPPGMNLPPGLGATDAISNTLGTMDPKHSIEVLAQMKAFTITHPDAARKLLTSHPQFSYAIFQSLIINKIIDPQILQRMIEETKGAAPALGSSSYPPPPPQQYPPPHLHAPQPMHGGYPGPGAVPPAPQQPYYAAPPAHMPAQPPPAPPASAGLGSSMSEEQRAMLMQVLQMTPEQINAMPETERAAVNQLRSQFSMASL
ncbi:hypothetical protein DL96DRAFT_1612165 [Flagelloscypha sp. PMI_526]|nr:hypothetical protein DL96DRAFT_1612165 [Flagelloscypha sp. PMI_526]